jgi:hypothetical protein
VTIFGPEISKNSYLRKFYKYLSKKTESDACDGLAQKEELTKRDNSNLEVELETLRKQITEINTSQLNKDGDITKLKVDRDRIAAEKKGLELILKQKDDELSKYVYVFIGKCIFRTIFYF